VVARGGRRARRHRGLRDLARAGGNLLICRVVIGSTISQRPVSYMIRSQPEANELDESGYYFYSVPETGAGLFLASGLGPRVGMRGENPIA